MEAIVVGLCAASGGASIGLLTGAMLGSGKIRDVEFAYSQLANPVRHFLKDHSSAENGGIVVSPQELALLRKALDASEQMIGL